MGKASRQKRRSSVTAARRSRSNLGWYLATAAVVVLGIVLVVFSAANRADPEPPLTTDHWHAALGVNVCGTWQPNPPEFANRFGSQLLAGIHSHGDGLIHIHPHTSDEAGGNATVGRFFSNGGWELSEDSISTWTGAERTNGDECDGEEATVRWSVNGEERDGNPADYRPQDLDVVAIAFLPADAEIGTPPSAANVTAPVDIVPPPDDTTDGTTDDTTDGTTDDTTDDTTDGTTEDATDGTTDTTAAPDATTP